ncbi:MAG TPA: hypothetical protein VIJ39_00125 [Solirubrobacteraceae bacterium]
MATAPSSSAKRTRYSFITTALVAPLAIGGVIACFSSSPALAATTPAPCSLYASTSGNDSNAGTASAPFATAKRLMEKLSAGQTGCLTSGQTFAGFTLSEGQTHGAESAPITLASTNPEEPATLDGRITTEKGADWLTFTHLNFVYGQDTLFPSVTIASAHTSWTYDDVSGGDLNICFLTNPVGDAYGTGEYTLIEHDRVHDCGHPVTKAELEAQSNDIYEGRENGWHTHGLYDEGTHTTVTNSYFYDDSGIGILLRSGGFAVIEHNVIDADGRGVELGNEGTENDNIAWNIISNTTSPCGREVAAGSHCDTYGLMTNGSVGVGSVFHNNDLYGNEGDNIEPGINGIVARVANVEVNPLYANAAAHEYTLEKESPVAGYGPDAAQSTVTSSAPIETTPIPPPAKTETPAPQPSKTETTLVSFPARTETTSTPAKTETFGTKEQSNHRSSIKSRHIARTASLRSRGKRHRDGKRVKRHHRPKK